MLYIKYDKCKLCNAYGIYRVKRLKWSIGECIDYCPECNKNYYADCFWDFFESEIHYFDNKVENGIPTRVLKD